MSSTLIFDKYALLQRIAHGGDGDIFLARQSVGIDRLVILKSYTAQPDEPPMLAQEFFDAARLAALVNHPNVVSIYDVGEWKGTFWIVMEYIDGKDLTGLWYGAASAGIGIPFNVTAQIVHDAALGLHNAHKTQDVNRSPLNLVHRDLSPPNIMVRRDGVTKIVDFGTARMQRRGTSADRKTKKRRLQYLSPEQVRGGPVDGRSDQFSLGIILWEMCTGKRLFKASNESETLQKVLRAQVDPPSQYVSNFPGRLEDVIMRMLSSDKEDRFPNCLEVANEIGVFQESTPRKKRVTVSQFMGELYGLEEAAKGKERQPDTGGAKSLGNPLDAARQQEETYDATIKNEPAMTSKDTKAERAKKQLRLDLDSSKPKTRISDSGIEYGINIQCEDGREFVYATIEEVRTEVQAGKLGPRDGIAINQNPRVSLAGHHELADLFPDNGADDAPGPVDSNIPSTALVVRPVQQGDTDEQALDSLFKSEDDEIAGEMPNHIDLKASLEEERQQKAETGDADTLDEMFARGVDSMPTTGASFEGQGDTTAPPHNVIPDQTASDVVQNHDMSPAYAGDDLSADFDPAVFGNPRRKLYWAAGIGAALLFLAILATTLLGGSDESATKVDAVAVGSDGFDHGTLFKTLFDDDEKALLNAERQTVGQGSTWMQLNASFLSTAQARKTLERARLAKSKNDEKQWKLKADILVKNAKEAAEAVIISKADSPWGYLAKAHVLSLGEDDKKFEAALEAATKRATETSELVEHERIFMKAYRAMYATDDGKARAEAEKDLLPLVAKKDRRAEYLVAVMQGARGEQEPAVTSIQKLQAAAVEGGHEDTVYAMLLSSMAPDVASEKPEKSPVEKTEPKTDNKTKSKDAATRTQRLLSLAREDLRKGANNAAREKCEEVLKKDSKNFKALVCSGDAMLALRQTAGALRSYRKATTVSPNSSAAALGLAKALHFANRTKDAKVQYKRVLDLRPSPSEAKKAEKALKSLEK